MEDLQAMVVLSTVVITFTTTVTVLASRAERPRRTPLSTAFWHGAVFGLFFLVMAFAAYQMGCDLGPDPMLEKGWRR